MLLLLKHAVFSNCVILNFCPLFIFCGFIKWLIGVMDGSLLHKECEWNHDLWRVVLEVNYHFWSRISLLSIIFVVDGDERSLATTEWTKLGETTKSAGQLWGHVQDSKREKGGASSTNKPGCMLLLIPLGIKDNNKVGLQPLLFVPFGIRYYYSFLGLHIDLLSFHPYPLSLRFHKWLLTAWHWWWNSLFCLFAHLNMHKNDILLYYYLLIFNLYKEKFILF